MTWRGEPSRLRRVWRIFVYVASLAVPLAAQSRIQFAGSVRAGQTFRKAIGSGLTLVLSPNGGADDDDSGWTIEVQPADQSDNFVRCVMLPLHGPTDADLVADQFVTEENEKLPESQLADRRRREFQFVLNTADQKKACDEMDVVASGPQTTAADGSVIIGTPGYQDPPLGSGTFTIKSLQMSNLGTGKKARLDALGFEVKIELPAVSKDRSSKAN